MTETSTIPTLDTVEDAQTLLRQLAETHDWVSVFWDRGWGDSGQKAEITIIVGGNGNDPKAHITADVYRALVDQHIIGENSYGGFKARRLHDYRTPPKPERTGPNPAKVAEAVVRVVLDDLADLSVRAKFFRGLNRGNVLNPINEEWAHSAGYARGWYVNVMPGHSEAVVTGWGNDYQGFGDTVGEAASVAYPKTADGAIDEAALRTLLADAIRAKHAEVVAVRTKAQG